MLLGQFLKYQLNTFIAKNVLLKRKSNRESLACYAEYRASEKTETYYCTNVRDHVQKRTLFPLPDPDSKSPYYFWH